MNKIKNHLDRTPDIQADSSINKAKRGHFAVSTMMKFFVSAYAALTLSGEAPAQESKTADGRLKHKQTAGEKNDDSEFDKALEKKLNETGVVPGSAEEGQKNAEKQIDELRRFTTDSIFPYTQPNELEKEDAPAESIVIPDDIVAFFNQPRRQDFDNPAWGVRYLNSLWKISNELQTVLSSPAAKDIFDQWVETKVKKENYPSNLGDFVEYFHEHMGTQIENYLASLSSETRDPARTDLVMNHRQVFSRMFVSPQSGNFPFVLNSKAFFSYDRKNRNLLANILLPDETFLEELMQEKLRDDFDRIGGSNIFKHGLLLNDDFSQKYPIARLIAAITRDDSDLSGKFNQGSYYLEKLVVEAVKQKSEQAGQSIMAEAKIFLDKLSPAEKAEYLLKFKDFVELSHVSETLLTALVQDKTELDFPYQDLDSIIYLIKESPERNGLFKSEYEVLNFIFSQADMDKLNALKEQHLQTGLELYDKLRKHFKITDTEANKKDSEDGLYAKLESVLSNVYQKIANRFFHSDTSVDTPKESLQCSMEIEGKTVSISGRNLKQGYNVFEFKFIQSDHKESGKPGEWMVENFYFNQSDIKTYQNAEEFIDDLEEIPVAIDFEPEAGLDRLSELTDAQVAKIEALFPAGFIDEESKKSDGAYTMELGLNYRGILEDSPELKNHMPKLIMELFKKGGVESALTWHVANHLANTGVMSVSPVQIEVELPGLGKQPIIFDHNHPYAIMKAFAEIDPAQLQPLIQKSGRDIEMHDLTFADKNSHPEILSQEGAYTGLQNLKDQGFDAVLGKRMADEFATVAARIFTRLSLEKIGYSVDPEKMGPLLEWQEKLVRQAKKLGYKFYNPDIENGEYDEEKTRKDPAWFVERNYPMSFDLEKPVIDFILAHQSKEQSFSFHSEALDRDLNLAEYKKLRSVMESFFRFAMENHVAGYFTLDCLPIQTMGTRSIGGDDRISQKAQVEFKERAKTWRALLSAVPKSIDVDGVGDLQEVRDSGEKLRDELVSMSKGNIIDRALKIINGQQAAVGQDIQSPLAVRTLDSFWLAAEALMRTSKIDPIILSETGKPGVEINLRGE